MAKLKEKTSGQPNYYEILGADPISSPELIRSSYSNRLAELKVEMANGHKIDPARLDAIRSAYKILADPATRAEYDLELKKAAKSRGNTPIRFSSGSWLHGLRRWRFPAGVAIAVIALMVGNKFAPNSHGASPSSAPARTMTALNALSCIGKIDSIKDPSQKLLFAAKCGDLALVTQLINQGVPVETRDTKPPNVGRTPLHYAAGENHVEVMRYLLEHGADPNAAADTGYTPLHVASGRGQLAAAQLLLDKGANPNAMDVRGPPLYATVLQAQPAIAELLLKAGADPNAKDSGGNTPLHALGKIGMFYSQHGEVIRILKDHGADLDALDGHGHTPLDIADRDAAAELIMNGAHMSSKDPAALLHRAASTGHQAPLEYLQKQGILQHDLRVTLAPDAVGYGVKDISALRFILAQGFDINGANDEGETALFRASQSCNQRAVELLLKDGAAVNPPALNKPTLSATFDRNAFHLNWPECNAIVTDLLKAGVDTKVTNEKGETILFFVADDPALRAQALQAGADPRARAKNGRTVLHQLLNIEKPETIDAFVKAGADPNAQGDDGNTPLHVFSEISVYGPRLEVARALIRNGAKPDIRNKAGQTPLDAYLETPWGKSASPGTNDWNFIEILRGHKA